MSKTKANAIDPWSRLGRQREHARKRQRESRVMGDMLAGAGALAGAFLTGYLFPSSSPPTPKEGTAPASPPEPFRVEYPIEKVEDPMPIIQAVDQQCEACGGDGTVQGPLGDAMQCRPCNGTGRVPDLPAERRALQSILGTVQQIERRLRTDPDRAGPYRAHHVDIADALETISNMAAAIDRRLEKLEESGFHEAIKRIETDLEEQKTLAEGLSDGRIVVLTAEFTHKGDGHLRVEFNEGWGGAPMCEIEAIRLIMDEGTVVLQHVEIGCWPMMSTKLHSDLLVKPVPFAEKRTAEVFAGRQPVARLLGNGAPARGHIVLYGRWVDPNQPYPPSPHLPSGPGPFRPGDPRNRY